MNTGPSDAPIGEPREAETDRQRKDEIKRLREVEIERLSKLPRFPKKLPDDERGVLLSDRIKYYCTKYQLVEPFEDERLRPAAYSLSVGRNYSILGELRALDDWMSLTIDPYQVAIIETLETLNMPEYLIGRWNVRTKKAYQGLLWVGGAQVDPGFRGHLCCPIYNLSTVPVTLAFREPLAEIDFETTTPFEEDLCKKFPWSERKMLVFAEYPFLSSGIAKQVSDFRRDIEDGRKKTSSELQEAREETETQFDEAAKRSENSFSDVRTRIDTFLTLTFTVLAVLFAGLGIVATKTSDHPDFLNPAVWVSALAFFFALRAQVNVRRDTRNILGSWPSAAVALITTAFVVIACQLFYAYQAHVSASEVRQAVVALDREKQVRQQSDARLQSLQRQVDVLLQNQVKKK